MSAEHGNSPWSGVGFWEGQYVAGAAPWDLEHPSPLLQQLEKDMGLLPGSHIIFPGCGRGHDAIYWARLGYRVSAVDWSQAAIVDLRNRARREKIEIEALACDYREIPESWEGTFDAWVEYTFFCAMDPSERPRYVQEAARMLRPGGSLIGAMFVHPQYDPKHPNISPQEYRPPFWTGERELRTLFEPSFEIALLKPSTFKHPAVGALEWMVHFKKRNT